jgi:nucleoid-associated protein YgaU
MPHATGGKPVTPQPSRATRGSALRALGLTLLALAAAGVLWRVRPAGQPAASATADADIVLGCAWLAWLLGGYLLIAVAVSALAHLATGVGVVSGAVARLAPARLRRLVDAAVTMSVAATILGATAATPAVASTPRHVTVSRAATSSVTGSPLDWPGLNDPARPPHPVASDPSSGEVVVVQPGDTLWSIAARHLGAGASGAAITTAWHAWYAANRAVIGANPSVIRPGQQLVAPAGQALPSHLVRTRP